MAQLISVKLSRFDGSPWGFRLQGGKDFGTPLIVQKVNNGSPAEAAGLRAGDAVIKVNNTEMFNLRHKDAQDVIVRAGNTFEVTVQRGGSTWRPSVSPVTPSIPSPQPHVPVGNVSPVTKTSLAAKKPEGPLIGSGHNFSPKPFLNGSSDGGAIKSIVNKQYNSPVGIYSEQTIAETLSAQAEVLAGGVLGVNFKKNEKNYNAQNSEVFKMVQEADKEPRSPEPIPSRTEFYSSVSKAIGGHATSPRSPTPIGRAMGYCHPALSVASSPRDDVHTTDEQLRLEQSSRASSTSDKRDRYETTFCHGCDCPIVGVFVRIKEKNLHVECFKCSTCGTSLKNVGYYNINNKLYCDIHAKLVARQQAPAGYVPITVPPGGKAPAGTISAALGNLTPCPKSPPLNGTSLAPALSTICRGTSDHGKPSRSCYRPIEFSPPTGPTEKDMIDEKTFTSTITIITGNEAVSKEECSANNRMKTNKNPLVTTEISGLRIEENKSPPVFNSMMNDDKIEKTSAVPHPITNNFQKYQSQLTKINRQNNANNRDRSNVRSKTNVTKTDVDGIDYNMYLNNHKQKFSQVISAMINGEDDNRTMSKYTNNDTRLKNEINHSLPLNFHTSSSSLATFLLAHRTTHPETLPASPTTPPDSSSSSISSSPIPPITTRTNHFGIPPIDTPSFHLVQTPSSNIGGPKPFSGTKVAPPNFSTPPVSNSAVNNFNRPQSQTVTGSGVGGIGPQGRKFAGSSAPKRGKGILNQAATGRQPVCGHCQTYVRGPFITALGQIWCPEHFVCVNPQCRRHLQDIGFVEEKGQLYCEYCFERFIAPSCNKCNNKIKGDCLTAIGKSYHPECFNCTYCGKLFGNSPFFLEEGLPYCEADWNELFTTKCYACGFPVEAGDRWVEALNNNYHSQCFNCTMCKKNLEGQSFYAKGGRPFCKNHAR
ncbi:PDZ and LIM domain protein Zasp isoform X7 [Diachasmimorpha longicaudata]|uniref:PDZ and LIM domain protein Zasp isoform X7 n=1 Tax=Diachasmimorpha longicaudata TaxID=58733 RepID=UPI0030B8CD01